MNFRKIGADIERIRQERNIPLISMCNCLDVLESDYYKIVGGESKISIYQIIMFIALTSYVPDGV